MIPLKARVYSYEALLEDSPVSGYAIVTPFGTFLMDYWSGEISVLVLEGKVFENEEELAEYLEEEFNLYETEVEYVRSVDITKEDWELLKTLEESFSKVKRKFKIFEF